MSPLVQKDLVESKKWYASKTQWFNLVMALVGFVYLVAPESKEYLNEGNILIAFSFVGFILRIVTKGKITW